MDYACDINEESIALLERASQKECLNIKCYPCDVSNEDSVCNFFNKISSDVGRLDVLVNNAGIIRDGLFVSLKDGQITKMPLSDFQSVINVNLTGVFLCAREAACIMIRNRSGVIINISSICRAGNYGQTNYSAAKSGVDAMTVTWSKELSRYNIRVAAIAPGYINTDMVKSIKPEVLEKLVSKIPLKRLGEVSDISKTVQFIIDNEYVNGRILEIDGGMRI